MVQIEMIKKILIQNIQDALINLKIEEKKILVTETDPQFGDYSSNVAMVHAKANGYKINKLAKKIVKILEKTSYYKKIDIAKNGFINFTLSNSIYYDSLKSIKDEKFQNLNYGEKKTVLVEFVSANPTGPLNIVSARAASFGDTLCNVMNFIGYKATKEFYVNDFGNQIDILAESIEIRYKELYSNRKLEFPAEAYHGEYVKDIAQKIASVEGAKLLSFSNDDRLEKFKSFALYEMLKSQKRSLENFRVKFDNWISEKTLREDNLVEETLSYLTEAGYTYEKEDAIWFKSSALGDEKDRILMKSDGNTTYFVPDIGYHINKYQRGYDYIIDVLGPDHHGYLSRMHAAVQAIGYSMEKLEFIILQQVNLFKDNHLIKMSKRSGNMITMDSLIKHVGVDAARFFFLARKTSSHLNFDIDLAKKKTSENPVYYCQYAHARICSLIRKAKKEKFYLKDLETSFLRKLVSPKELNLIKKMMQLPSVLESVVINREPNKLTNYTLELSGFFHKYYGSTKMISIKNKKLTLARLYLCSCIKITLATCLELMGISAPDRM